MYKFYLAICIGVCIYLCYSFLYEIAEALLFVVQKKSRPPCTGPNKPDAFGIEFVACRPDRHPTMLHQPRIHKASLPLCTL